MGTLTQKSRAGAMMTARDDDIMLALYSVLRPQVDECAGVFELQCVRGF
jgi:hypothetical protein